ncbi:hypothetical protein [Streptomyces vilmorinianum]|uniref:hypothetical protein n=1 Tax=Streptomyces vilmorinianum TaxID=3051092 RepID=UPI0010FB6260|nr:hypothetical protein [Streptomyces vilmorinianum]
MRGAAAGITLVLALAGCSEGSTSGGGAGESRAADAPFNPSQLAQAIPSELAAPKGWKGDSPLVRDGSKLRKLCEQGARFSCAGLTSYGNSRYSTSGAFVDFELLAYDSVDNAKVGMKSMVADIHDGKPDAKPLTVDAGADETDAYADGNRPGVVLRVGTVVAFVFGETLPKDNDLQSFAKFQVQRINTAATGKNPDA